MIDSAGEQTVPLEVVRDAQRALLGAGSLGGLADACWTLSRRLAEVTSIRLYRRSAAGPELLAALPPSIRDDAGIRAVLRSDAGRSRSPVSQTSGIVTAWAPGQPSGGVVVVEHGGGDETALAAVATIAAGALGMLLECERRREHDQRQLAQVLHDGVVQDLAYINLRIELLERSLDADLREVRRLLADLRGDVATASDGLRAAIGELRRTNLLEPSAKAGSGEHADVERAVLGIVREALTNIRKHADATEVHVELSVVDGRLTVTVRDNGVGMQEPIDTVADGHFGISQMRELAAELGGTLAVEGDSGGGTRVVAQIPMGLVEWAW